MAKISFTTHAVEQFISRHASEMSFAEARAYLEEHGPRASRMREKTCLGQQQWQLQEPRCVLVIKGDRREGLVCVTVLPTKEMYGGMTEDELEILREAAEAHPPVSPKGAYNFKEAIKAPSVRKTKGPPTLEEVQRSSPKAARADEVIRLHQLMVERAIKADEARERHHREQMNTNHLRLKNCLRASLRYLLQNASKGDALALEILEEIQATEPGLLTEGFIGLTGEVPRGTQ